MHRFDVYRGQRTVGPRYLPTILLTLLAIILIGFIALFFTLPGHLVYTRDSVRLDLPSLQGESAVVTPAMSEGEPSDAAVTEGESGEAPDYSTLTAELVVKEPDYSALNYATGEGLEIVQSVYVPYEKVNGDGLTAAIAQARALDVKALTLELRDESGVTLWSSKAELAEAYGLNGTTDVRASIEDLKKQGYRLTAVISCCVDNTLAARNAPAALKNAAGLPYADNGGSWMDPWDAGVRSLSIQLTKELMEMGFDEVVLNHVEHPVSDVGYSRTMSGNLTRVASVTNFAIAVREGVEETMAATGAKLSAMISTEALNNASYDNGQNLAYFLHVFDRVYEFTETYSEASQVVSLGIDSTERFVPIISWVFPGASWVQNPFADK